MEVTGEPMSEKKSFLSRMWEAQYGKQYGITAIISGASGILLGLCAYQLLFLQDHPDWNQHTGLALTLGFVSAIIFLLAFPEFLRFRGHIVTLEEIMEIQSTAELRRQKTDGDISAQALGAGYLAQWNEFLDSRGLRR
ncbi:MAG TPA: hypothetical protein QGI72_02840 [Poseidonia sp.]|nr:hypothetical protein [Poseidonia sp.]